MAYPFRLIPKKTDIILSALVGEEILCRWIHESLTLKDAEGRLEAEAVDEVRIFDYSVNKLPPSEIEDIFISFFDTSKFNENWIEATEGYKPEDDEFTLLENRGFFLFRVSDIHNYKATYPYPADKEHNHQLAVQVIHKPLISNIAHCELHIEFFVLAGDAPAEKIPGKGSRKVIAADLRQKLIKIAKFDLKSFN